jgi:glutamyl-tRNA synthetase
MQLVEICVCVFSRLSTKESEDSVLADLTWLGLHWDEGPDDMEARYGPYRQSERNEIYSQIANYLLQQGKAYRCFCTTEELEEMKAAQEAAGLQPRYDGRWRDAPQTLVEQKLAVNSSFTVRFKVAPGSRVVIDDAVRGTVSWDADATVGDFILLRSNGVPVYNFCVAVDDAMMGITTVIRAEEHLTNTLRQGLILDALGAPRPRYAHCSLILGEDKQKLSKRHGATSCNQFRLDGFLPDAMINYLALLGWNDGTDNEIFARDELIEAFELSRVVKSPSVFDMNKLRWVNAQHMKRMPVDELVPLVEEQLKFEDVLRPISDDEDRAAYQTKVRQLAIACTSLAKQMMETTKDAVLNGKRILGYNLPVSFEQVSDEEGAKTMIEQGNFYPLAKRLIHQFEAGLFPLPNPNAPLAAFQDAVGEAIEDAAAKGATCTFTTDYMTYMKALAKEEGIKGRNLFHPIRLALTGEMSGQDVTKQLSLLTMASRSDSVVDATKAGIVTLEERIRHLKDFVETIPEQYRAPSTEVKNKGGSDSAANGSAVTAQAGSGSSTAQSEATDHVAKVCDPLHTYSGPPITALDIRVGRIVKVWEHPEADKLYCEEIDVGEENPRQIASGLRPYMKAEDMEGRMVLVLCNLKERKMVGFPSHGMVLCASNKDHTEVKFVSPPFDAKVGERVTVPDIDFSSENGQPYAENAVAKKKIFEDLAPHLVTSKYGVPEFLGRPFMTSAGVCTSPIPEGSVS